MKKIKIFILIGTIVFMATSFAVQAFTANIPGPNRAPVAVAGMDQTVEVNEKVMFDGSYSFDPDGDKLTYEWQLLYRPSDGRSELTGTRGMTTCGLTPDAAGTWIVALVVCDGNLFSARNVVQVRVDETSAPPHYPDLEVIDIKVLGATLAGIKYIQKIQARVRNNGLTYSGPVDFRVVALDSLFGGYFLFDDRMSVDFMCLRPGDEEWFTLVDDQLEWPSEAPQITFFAQTDPANSIIEEDESNNSKEITKQRNTLSNLQIFYPYIPYSYPDFAVSDFKTEGLYLDSYVNQVKVQIENKGKEYNGPVSIRFNALHKANILVSKIITIDNLCLSRKDKTWVTLSRREIEIPEDAFNIRYFIDIDYWNHITELNEENNEYLNSVPVGDLITHCNGSIFNEIRVRDYQARMSTLKDGLPFRFNCEAGTEFDFFITLQNYCSPDNAVELFIVFDWTPLKSDGKNIVLKEGIHVNLPYVGQFPLNLYNIKIPTNTEFQNDFSTFAIFARHSNGSDLLFSAPVEVRR